ncbi:MAG: PqqD family protein [Ruminococcaceae bacterium]|nr:PqqD family protein [Oscillospiraceae bacterium]
MAKKKKVIDGNYLDKIPVRLQTVGWKADDGGIVTLEIENTGWVNRLAQKLFFRPKISYVHLDEFGSFIWPLIDGKTSILAIGDPVKEKFGEKAEPLYPRLAEFFRILESYHFIRFSD